MYSSPLDSRLLKLGLTLAVLTLWALPRGMADPQKTGTPQGPSIGIEAKFVEFTQTGYADFIKATSLLKPKETQLVLNPAKFESVMQVLQKQPGEANLISAPKVFVKSKQEAEIEIAREFRFATEFTPPKGETPCTPTAFDAKMVGVILRVKPEAAKDGKALQLRAIPSFTEFLGLKNLSDKAPIQRLFDYDKLPISENILDRVMRKGVNGQNPAATANGVDGRTPTKPIFSAYQKDAHCQLATGQTIALRLSRQPVAGEKLPRDPRVFLVFVTARVLPGAEAAKILEDSAKAYPLAIMRPGDKKGFVRSPYKPDAAPVEVHAAGPGVLQKCPYTGNLFRVPTISES
ncbi:MAG: hypothetical protein PHQ12_00890 [Chthoniobacteraceae bacterium]|nr:hypothetical protein [Chthoniobacteraceae bacterium]